MESAIPLTSFTTVGDIHRSLDRDEHPTISLLNRLCERASQLLRMGVLTQAEIIMNQLLSFRNLPATLRESIHLQKAEIFQLWNQPRRARRHLLAALAINSGNSRTHHLLGMNLEGDSESDPERAWYHYRKSVRLDSTNPKYWLALARFAARLGKIKSARAAFLKAQVAAPRSVEVLEQVIQGLLALGLRKTVSRIMNTSRFLFRGNSSFESLWNRYRFGNLFLAQSHHKTYQSIDQVEARILPMLRVVSLSDDQNHDSTGTEEATILRHDHFSKRHNHLLQVDQYRPGPKRHN